MPRKNLILAINLFLFLVAYNTITEAGVAEGEDGLYYTAGIPYYLVIDSGSHFYTVANLKSTQLYVNPQGKLLITFDTICYGPDDTISRQATWQVTEEIKTGNIYLNSTLWYDKDSKYSTENFYSKRIHLYKKIRASALENQQNRCLYYVTKFFIWITENINKFL